MTNQKRVAVGMSGGVDSSVAAAKLLDAGHEPVGFTLILKDDALKCVSEQDAEAAAEVARMLDIEHHVIDARDEFERTIIAPFAQEYSLGRTPSPCVRCNPAIKFKLLREHGRRLGCECIATGHYARTLLDEDGMRHIYRDPDNEKDQTYFLQRLTQEELRGTIFPLADMVKTEVRLYAAKRKLPCATHSESQDLCFAERGRYAELVARYHPRSIASGDIVDTAGKRLGGHDGIHNFTVGQRRGPGVATGERYYVLALESDENRVVMGPRSEAMRRECIVSDMSWICGKPPAANAELVAQPRYRHPGARAHLEDGPDPQRMKVVFAKPQFALSPGQALAVYLNDELLGGGWIEG